MAARQRAIKVGSEVELDGRAWKVVRVGKECKLESNGETVWRHSRTIGRLLEEKRASKPRETRKAVAA